MRDSDYCKRASDLAPFLASLSEIYYERTNATPFNIRKDGIIVKNCRNSFEEFFDRQHYNVT